MIRNYIKHLKYFIFSPTFPVLLGVLLGTIFFMFYIIYFVPVNLCDDTLPIKDLIDKLDHENSKLHKISLSISSREKNLNVLDLWTSKNTNGGFIHRKVWTSQLKYLYKEQEILLNDINKLLKDINSLESIFGLKEDFTGKK